MDCKFCVCGYECQHYHKLNVQTVNVQYDDSSVAKSSSSSSSFILGNYFMLARVMVDLKPIQGTGRNLTLDGVSVHHRTQCIHSDMLICA